MVQDDSSPFFTTPHFDGRLSVLLRASRIGEITYNELAEVVQDARLSRASAARRSAWLKSTYRTEAEDQRKRLAVVERGGIWRR